MINPKKLRAANSSSSPFKEEKGANKKKESYSRKSCKQHAIRNLVSSLVSPKIYHVVHLHFNIQLRFEKKHLRNTTHLFKSKACFPGWQPNGPERQFYSTASAKLLG